MDLAKRNLIDLKARFPTKFEFVDPELVDFESGVPAQTDGHTCGQQEIIFV